MNLCHLITLLESDRQGDATAVFNYGRFQCPTRGHERLIKTVISEAAAREADHFIFPSRSHDPIKNPLDPETKIKFLRELFPFANIVDDPTVKNPFSALRFLLERRYEHLVLVVGGDRVDSMRSLKNSALKTFKTFEIVSAGQRDPDGEGVGGMSGTKARQAALAGNITAFRNATGWTGDVSVRLMAAVRAGMTE
jgi:hypothetical protein